jgi:enamine deaminase RidA (YjgF/YER057c/UK114 family)
MSEIVRIGAGKRWSDVVVYGGVARWVEVAENAADDARGQIGQVLRQIDQTAAGLGIDRRSLLEVVIYLADPADAPTLNELWDAWVVAGQAPIRACLGATLSGGLRIEAIVHAAVAGG